MEPYNYDEDPEDLEFTDPEDRARELGLDLKQPTLYVPASSNQTPSYQKVGPVNPNVKSLLPPPPGYIEITLGDLARSRGIVNPKGPHRGKVSLSGMIRGTNIAHTSLWPLLHSPEKVRMLHLDTVARICAFLDAQPGEWLQYVPGIREAERRRELARASRRK